MGGDALVLRAIVGLGSRARRECVSEQAQEQSLSSFLAAQTIEGKVVVVPRPPNRLRTCKDGS